MFEEREPIVVTNKGQKIFGILHRPIHLVNPPFVVIFHGFASTKVGSNRSYVKLAESLAKEGIGTFRFDFRGSGDSEGDLNELSIEDLVLDGIAVCQELFSRGVKRIGFFGSSFGGTVSILTAEKVKEVKALALWAPLANGRLWTNSWEGNLATYQGVTINDLFKEQFENLNVTEVANRLNIPLLHMQGEGDKVITLEQQTEFKKALKERRECRFITYQEADHRLGFSKVYPEVVSELINWFKEYV